MRRGEGPGPSRRNSPPARPPPPTHGRTGGTPQGVFKPPRRNALGTWTARGRTRRGGPDQRPAPRLSRRPSGKAGAESQRAGPGGAAQRGAAEAAGTRLGPDGSRRDGNDDDGPRRRGGHRDPPPRRDAENRPRPPRARRHARRGRGRGRGPLPAHARAHTHTVPVPVASPLLAPFPSSPALAAGGAGPLDERHTGPARTRAAGGTRSGRRGRTRRHRHGFLSFSVNDPSAGSPTETLLRLLLPLDSQVRPSSQRSARAVGRPRRGRSEGLTKPSNR